MADLAHVELVRSGSKALAAWVDAHPKTPLDLRGADLSGLDLRGGMLPGADLRGASLAGARLSGAWLPWANLTGSKVTLADLSEANLTRARLRGADIRESDLSEAKLHEANLEDAYLTESNLSAADLSEALMSKVYAEDANLTRADLRRARLEGAQLMGANLMRADLTGADLIAADLSRADLSRARFAQADLRRAKLAACRLRETDFYGADLSAADVSGAIADGTLWTNVDLSAVVGLEAVEHRGPSTLGIDSLMRSRGRASEDFLKRCGVPVSFLEQARGFLRALDPLAQMTIHLSYGADRQEDAAFAHRLHTRLRREQLRVWYSPEGQAVESATVRRAYAADERRVVIISADGLASDWLGARLKSARDLAETIRRRRFCPVVLASPAAFAAWSRVEDGIDLAGWLRDFGIIDFAAWRDDAAFERAYAALRDRLRASAPRAQPSA